MGIITLRQAAEWCGGWVDPKYADVTFFGANNDTRKLSPGELFVALAGVRDGHDFVGTAFEKGATAVLCTHCDGDYPAIVVDDTRLALGDIARGERQKLGMKVVAVTGSVGKSTTKEMIACVLEENYIVSKTPANHNNDIGMPMAILAMPENTELAVLEMGMNHFREIAYLAAIGKPDVAVIINIGTMHMENLGSREGILKAKLEILEGLAADGKAIFNGDDALLWGCAATVDADVTYFGANKGGCSVQAKNVREENGSIFFTVCHSGGEFDIVLPVEGMHFVPDALAAIAVGLSLGVKPAGIAARLAKFRNMAGRQEIFQAKGCTIIKDCYNAGPESMAAALTVLGNRPGRRIAVLGDMLELGTGTQAEHYRVGRIAAEKAQLLFAYGPNAPRVVSGAITGGMSVSAARAYSDRDQLAEALRHQARAGDVILFKGSHGMHMELALEAFLKEDK
ncbi:MAG: UDP-N-acetylmuramoyl-tripeptide--D-alanyl-D-alanine ligase [Oscillospiraceae bacterium]|nr:UDP-N-acetylmuramoyl-tripeptide--D-alanyl-D-alanine ligase [Oscillospiraceae bacterium]